VKSKLSLQLPFLGSWFVFWGGDSKELNHHYSTASQRYAFDFVKTGKDGAFYHGAERTNNKSLSFGQAVLAAADGTVVEAVGTVRDNKPGDINTSAILGNYLLIEHSSSEYSVLAHLQQHTLKVKAGDKVRAGQHVASCGNSGYSTDAHIHFHLQDSSILATVDEQYQPVNVAMGIKAYFSSVIVEREDSRRDRILYSPIKGDAVRTRLAKD
jgi:hypothetical protein